MCPHNYCAFTEPQCDLHNDFVCHHSDCEGLTMTLCGTMTLHNLQMTCMPFRMTICATYNATLFYNDIMYPHNDFCALIMTLCANTRTLCGLIVTLSFPVNDADIPSNEPCHHNSLCHAHAFCMTCLQWLCVRCTMTYCDAHNDFMCPHNDYAWNRHTMSVCVLTMTL